MTETPNHGYNIPEEGTENWHVPLNQNFNRIDADIEIRAPESNRKNYDPKEGTKYEATDSGAVYYGNGTEWVLIDRQVGHVESDSFSTGEYLKSGDSSTAVVAPSVSSAFNGIQEAIDTGFQDIILAEEVTEAGIVIPETHRPFRLEGVGDGMWQTINSPGGEEFVIASDRETENKYVHIKNINIEGGSNSGIAILGAKNQNEAYSVSQSAHSWVLENVRSRAGPVYLSGFRNMLYHCDIGNISEREFPIPKTTVDSDDSQIYDRPALVSSGATFSIHGGTFSAKTAARTGAYLFNGAFSITGGTTFSNTRKILEGEITSNVNFVGCGRGFISGVSTEYSERVDYDVQLGLEKLQDSPEGGNECLFFASNSAFNSLNIEDICDNIIIYAFTDLDMRKIARGRIHVVGNNTVEIEDDPDTKFPHDITHVNPIEDGTYRIGGFKNSPPTPLGLQIQTSKPDFPQEASFVVADGENWDPTGNGNAALLAYDTDGSWKPIFEYSDTL